MDDFANAPLGIDEIRSDRSNSAGDISPRSTLIALLRQIDKGEINPSILVVAWATEVKDDGRVSGWNASSTDLMASIGLLHRTAHRMMVNTDD